MVASLLAMGMNRLEKQITYDCPPYCAVDHMHYCPATEGAGLDVPSGYYKECVER